MAPGGSNEPTIILAGGGSGGHIQPGVAIAERVLELRPGATIHFIAKDQALDRAILEAGGWEHTTIDAAPFAMSPRALLRLAPQDQKEGSRRGSYWEKRRWVRGGIKFLIFQVESWIIPWCRSRQPLSFGQQDLRFLGRRQAM